MDSFIINGGRTLQGTVRVHGSKNASLPLMAAALLTDRPVTIHDVPDLSDIRNMTRLLGTLGCQTTQGGTAGQTVTIHATDPSLTAAPYDIVKTMRAGICVLGPILARRGKARVSMPGGCAIGDRPVDLHLRGLRALGAEISLDAGDIVAVAPEPDKRLIGAHVFLGGPSGSTVLGTANVLCAATLARGRTIIESAACEPEVEDLANLLIQMGAKIQGAGSPRLIIDGVDQLSGAEHRVIPDRIEAGTYVCAAAITRSPITLENFPTDALGAALDRLHAIGVEVTPNAPAQAFDRQRGSVTVQVPDRLKPVQVFTQPHPGFPTDLQAQIMSLLCLADGNSSITEKIFPDRFLHVAELLRMGAELTRNGPSVVVSGVKQLIGAPVMASDLRASAGLVLAGLAAKGTTTVNRVYHLDRGYERMEVVLQGLGADIQRVKEEDL